MTASPEFALQRQSLRPVRRQRCEPAVTDPASVIAALIGKLAVLLGPTIDLRTTLDPSAGLVPLDTDRLQQIVLQLALNARDAMPNGGCVAIESAARELRDPVPHRHGVVASGDYVVITVRDDGAGLSETALAHIFDPFWTPQRKGASHGLSTVYGIVKQGGGHLIVTSADGEGTTVDLYLHRLQDVTARAQR